MVGPNAIVVDARYVEPRASVVVYWLTVDLALGLGIGKVEVVDVTYVNP